MVPNLTPLNNFYAGLRVVFANTEWWNVTPTGGDPPGVSGLKIRSISDAQFPPITNPLVATFSFAVTDISFMALDVGAAGPRINAYDAAVGGSLVAFDEEFGTGIGFYNHVLLSSGRRHLPAGNVSTLARLFGWDGYP